MQHPDEPRSLQRQKVSNGNWAANQKNGEGTTTVTRPKTTQKVEAKQEQYLVLTAGVHEGKRRETVRDRRRKPQRGHPVGIVLQMTRQPDKHCLGKKHEHGKQSRNQRKSS